MANYVGALDQGTTSNRFIIFDHGGNIIGLDQKEHEQIFPKPGWVEHNPAEIWQNTRDVIRGALAKSGLSGSDLTAIGITNQRETTVLRHGLFSPAQYRHHPHRLPPGPAHHPGLSDR